MKPYLYCTHCFFLKGRLFGMSNDGDNRVGVSLHLKIESPVTIYSGLPNIIGLIGQNWLGG
jgi:hypothetical protein